MNRLDRISSKLASDAIAARVASSMTAGTTTRTIRGTGWTEQEALQNALRRDEEENGHGEGYGGGSSSLKQVLKTKMLTAPKRPKRVQIEKFPIKKGPVEKRFIIEKEWGFSREEKIDNDRRLNARYETQGQVIQAAKDLALEYGKSVVIKLGAFCTGDTKLAVVKPEAGQIGEWAFSCDFRE